MAVMEAKWRGKCASCGVVILPGTLIDFERVNGKSEARHVSMDACALALADPPVEPALRGPRDIGAADFEKLTRLLLAQRWKFASTLAHIPHNYTLRKHWASDADFVWVINALRRSGYQQRFGAMVYLYTDIGEHQYWDCAAAGFDESKWIDVMELDPRPGREGQYKVAGINRAVLKKAKAKDQPSLLFEE